MTYDVAVAPGSLDAMVLSTSGFALPDNFADLLQSAGLTALTGATQVITPALVPAPQPPKCARRAALLRRSPGGMHLCAALFCLSHAPLGGSHQAALSAVPAQAAAATTAAPTQPKPPTASASAAAASTQPAAAS